MSTICAISTAPGVGGIAVIRVSGPDTFKICDRIFRPKKAGKSLSTQKAYTLTYGSIVGNNDETIDEVIAAVFCAPHSFTGEDTVEITCHGSTYIQQQILQSLISSGCRIAQPGEYTQRAFMNGKMDLSQAEAVADLIASTSAGQHRLALSQMRGGFSRELAELRNQLLHFTSLMELELDFSDHEELEFADRSELRTLADHIEQVISKLAQSFSVGNAIKNGIPVAIIGETNAGKSTLMRILVALMEPTSGQVEICGYDLMKQRKEIRGILGYLPQDFRFFAKYKTYEFLDYAARLSGMTHSRQRKQAVDEMLENVGLFDVRERYANKLSGGMKRRLGIAQALIHHPKVIIVDEPTTGLDPEERIRFRNLLSEVSENDVTIILSTHIVGDISSTCNNMALMNRGQVSFNGSPQDMLKLAEGKVWRIRAAGDQLHEIDKKYPVISTIPSGTIWEVQVVADKVEGYEAEPFPPNLEHAYVYYMENQLNLWTND